MKTARPIVLKKKHWKPIESLIEDIFYEAIFSPIDEILNDHIKYNSKADVERLIATGEIEYEDGYFYNVKGDNKRVFRSMGATFDRTRKAYTFDIVPDEWAGAILQQTISASNKTSRIEKITQQSIDLREITKKLEKSYEFVYVDLEEQLKSTIKGIEIPLSPSLRSGIIEKYTNDLVKYIVDFTDEETKKLRGKVTDHASSGKRFESLIKIIQDEKNVSRNKATFLARQETSLFMAQYRQQRYQGLGLKDYIWRIRGIRTREDHKELDGTRQSWASPPIVDKRTGRRGHPSEDYGCYCMARPIIE